MRDTSATRFVQIAVLRSLQSFLPGLTRDQVPLGDGVSCGTAVVYLDLFLSQQPNTYTVAAFISKINSGDCAIVDDLDELDFMVDVLCSDVSELDNLQYLIYISRHCHATIFRLATAKLIFELWGDLTSRGIDFTALPSNGTVDKIREAVTSDFVESILRDVSPQLRAFGVCSWSSFILQLPEALDINRNVLAIAQLCWDPSPLVQRAAQSAVIGFLESDTQGDTNFRRHFDEQYLDIQALIARAHPQIAMRNRAARILKLLLGFGKISPSVLSVLKPLYSGIHSSIFNSNLPAMTSLLHTLLVQKDLFGTAQPVRLITGSQQRLIALDSDGDQVPARFRDHNSEHLLSNLDAESLAPLSAALVDTCGWRRASLDPQEKVTESPPIDIPAALVLAMEMDIASIISPESIHMAGALSQRFPWLDLYHYLSSTGLETANARECAILLLRSRPRINTKNLKKSQMLEILSLVLESNGQALWITLYMECLLNGLGPMLRLGQISPELLYGIYRFILLSPVEDLNTSIRLYALALALTYESRACQNALQAAREALENNDCRTNIKAMVDDVLEEESVSQLSPGPINVSVTLYSLLDQSNQYMLREDTESFLNISGPICELVSQYTFDDVVLLNESLQFIGRLHYVHLASGLDKTQSAYPPKFIPALDQELQRQGAEELDNISRRYAEWVICRSLALISCGLLDSSYEARIPETYRALFSFTELG